MSPHIAHEVQKMMIAVVDFGTGVAAQIPGVVVAGKTGTAELRRTPPVTANNPNAGSPQNTDAWFVGYAPGGPPASRGRRAVPKPGRGGRGGRAPGPRHPRGRAAQGLTGRGRGRGVWALGGKPWRRAIRWGDRSGRDRSGATRRGAHWSMHFLTMSMVAGGSFDVICALSLRQGEKSPGRSGFVMFCRSWAGWTRV